MRSRRPYYFATVTWKPQGSGSRSNFARHSLRFEHLLTFNNLIYNRPRGLKTTTTMTDKLPPNLLALFAPRPPLRWVPPSDHAPEERKTAHVSGIAALLPQLQEYKENDDYTPTESWLQRKDRVKLEKKQRQQKLLKEGPSSCEGNPICFDYLLSPPVRILTTRRFDAHILLTLRSPRQTSRRPKYSRRCIQDIDRRAPQL